MINQENKNLGSLLVGENRNPGHPASREKLIRRCLEWVWPQLEPLVVRFKGQLKNMAEDASASFLSSSPPPADIAATLDEVHSFISRHQAGGKHIALITVSSPYTPYDHSSHSLPLSSVGRYNRTSRTEHGPISRQLQ